MVVTNKEGTESRVHSGKVITLKVLRSPLLLGKALSNVLHMTMDVFLVSSSTSPPKFLVHDLS